MVISALIALTYLGQLAAVVIAWTLGAGAALPVALITAFPLPLYILYRRVEQLRRDARRGSPVQLTG